MDFLEAADSGGVALQGFDPGHGCVGTGKRGDGEDTVLNGGFSDGAFVVEGLSSQGCVDDQIHFSTDYPVYDVGPAFVDLVHPLDGKARGAEISRRAPSGNETKSYSAKPSGHIDQGGLVVVVDGEKGRA